MNQNNAEHLCYNNTYENRLGQKNGMLVKFPVSLWRNRELWWRLTERDIVGRYKSSLLGMSWSFITPLAMLAVYTFVFSQVFKARWSGVEQTSSLAFAINLFAGLIVFNLIAECVNRAPSLILSHENYVKKVVFPIDILAAVVVGSAVFNSITSLCILILFRLISVQTIPVTSLWLPAVWLPVVLIGLALTWILSSLGVFLRDIGQIVGVAINMLMFLSPVFFPLSALPDQWKPILQINPLAHAIEQTRTVLILGQSPDPGYLIIGSIAGILICELSYRFFKKSQRAFADVI